MSSRRREADIGRGGEPAHEPSGSLESRVTELERELTSVRDSGRGRDDGPSDMRGDAPWRCCKCNSLIAFYDRNEDVLRVRYKDLYMWVGVGVGGFVQIVCRNCGQSNRQDYVDQSEGAEKSPPA